LIQDFKERDMIKKMRMIHITVIFLTFIIIGLIIIKNMSIRIQSNDTLRAYKNEYYDINIPDNWSYSSPINNSGLIILKIEKSYVANIEVNMPWEYGMTISSILSNWMGMHAYIEGDITEKELNGYKMIKAYVAYEQPPSDVDVEPVKLHYFFLKDKEIINLTLDPKFTTEELADKIAESLIMNSN
jgi:hypothetical protein